MKDVSKLIKNNTLKIIVKANSNITDIIELGADYAKIAVKSHPEKNKANRELLKFLSKSLKRKAIIKSGMNRKEKIILFD